MHPSKSAEAQVQKVRLSFHNLLTVMEKNHPRRQHLPGSSWRHRSINLGKRWKGKRSWKSWLLLTTDQVIFSVKTSVRILCHRAPSSTSSQACSSPAGPTSIPRSTWESCGHTLGTAAGNGWLWYGSSWGTDGNPPKPPALPSSWSLTGTTYTFPTTRYSSTRGFNIFQFPGGWSQPLKQLTESSSWFCCCLCFLCLQGFGNLDKFLPKWSKIQILQIVESRTSVTQWRML